MLKGIEEAAAFVLFLSTGVLERPYCQMEIRHALALKKPVVLLHGEKSQHKMRSCAPLPFISSTPASVSAVLLLLPRLR